MKVFYISTAIFFAMIVIVFYNYIYVNRTADRLEETVSNILASGKDDMNEKITELENFWNKNKDKLDFTTNHQIVNSIGIKISNIRLFDKNGDIRQLERELLLLLEEIKELRRLERFSFENIF